MRINFIFSIVLILGSTLAGQSWKIIHNSKESLTLSIEYPDLSTAYEIEELFLTVGLPSPNLPNIRIDQLVTIDFQLSENHPFRFEPAEKPVEWIRIEKFRDLNVALLRITPVLTNRSSNLSLVTNLQLSIHFPKSKSYPTAIGWAEEALYKNHVINWDIAKNWLLKPSRPHKMKKTTFPDGSWYKIPIETDGIYKLTWDHLSSAGIDVTTINPKSIGLYTNPQGGRPMSSEIGANIPENLVEVAIKIYGEDDGSFDSGDEIIFYGRGPRGFDSSGATEVTFTQHPYTDINYYWLNIPDNQTVIGKRILTDNTSYDDAVPLNYGIGYVHFESDVENPFKSGLLWVGSGFTKNQTVSISFNLYNPVDYVDATISMAVFGGTAVASDEIPHHNLKIFQKSKNDLQLVTKRWNGISKQQFKNNDLDESLLEDGPNLIVFENASTDNASKLHIDWATVKYGRELVWEDSPIDFWSPPNVSVAEFKIGNGNSDLIVWNVADFTNPVEYPVQRGDWTFETSLPSDQPIRFVIFSQETIPEVSSPLTKSSADFSSLRRETYPVDHIIIAPEEFLTPANKLQAYRKNSIVAQLETIYDEFSGGVQDPLAIRYFLKWTKEHWRDPVTNSFPSFVLLFGDGDYDYRNISGNANNFIPTFQPSNGVGISSDDRFAYLDSKFPDMAIGRFPASNLSEAESMTDKTIDYESNPEIGLWRRRITLIADDFARPNYGAIELTHTKNSEELSSMIPKTLEVEKLYMEEYPKIKDASRYGVARPDASEALFDILEQGTVLLNYIGHGSAYQWAQEGLLVATRGDLALINTGMQLPIWVAATCSWGNYDKVEGSAMSEEILRLPENGAIAIISTTGRITFSANKEFIIDFFRSLFPSGNITRDRLGHVFQSIKDGTLKGEYFHLFGDPALRLALTPNSVEVSEVKPDTLNALSTGNYSGKTYSNDPSQGEGYAVLYDADRSITRTYVYETYTEDVKYKLPGRTLFRGIIPFENRIFRGRFIVPKDINYTTNDGRLVVYLYKQNGSELWEGMGVKEKLIFSGGKTNPLDNEGPLISFTLENRTLEWGDHINTNSDLIINLSDPLGINITGEIGHAIRIWFDEDEKDDIELTHQFIYDPESYQSGNVVYSLAELDQGETILTVEAWDNANNPSRKSILLNLTSGTKLVLSNVFNYPNPFKRDTQFGFEVNQEAFVKIKIFTITGQLVKVLEPMETFYGYSYINWDGLDDFGDQIANGVYLYQIEAESVEGGKRVTKINKIAKYR